MCMVDTADGIDEFRAQKEFRARKPHRCDECGTAINPGDTYVNACNRYPVTAECFADTLHLERGRNVEYRYGYRAGTTPAERAEYTQRRRERLKIRVAEAAWLRTQRTEAA